jgi:hypothetical protein
VRAKVAFVIFFVILTSPFLVGIAGGQVFSPVAKPNLEKPKDASKCVEDIEFMRANHMHILKEERESAVRYGVRTKKHSLKNCFTCHTDKTKFCDRCHAYAGVKPTCFSNSGGCHFPPGGDL